MNSPSCVPENVFKVLLGRLADRNREREDVAPRAGLGHAAIARPAVGRAPGAADVAVQANPAVRVLWAGRTKRRANLLLNHDGVIVGNPNDSSGGTSVPTQITQGGAPVHLCYLVDTAPHRTLLTGHANTMQRFSR